MGATVAQLCDVVYKEMETSLPENILGKIAISVSVFLVFQKKKKKTNLKTPQRNEALFQTQMRF